MPVKTLCKQSSPASARGKFSLSFPPASDTGWGALIILLLHLGHPSTFPASYVPHVVWWHYRRGSVKPLWVGAGRDPQPLGKRLERKAFFCPSFKCTNSSRFPNSAQGGHISVSKCLEKGVTPALTDCPEPFVGASQSWAPRYCLCQLGQVGDAGGHSECRG